MPRRPPALTGGSTSEFWTFNLAKLAIIWFFELGLMLLILRTDMKGALWEEPSEDWPAVNLAIKIGTITMIVLITIDILFYSLSRRGPSQLRFSPAFYFWSCILKDFIIVLVIAALETAQIRSRRNDRGMGWLLMNSILQGLFLGTYSLCLDGMVDGDVGKEMPAASA